MHLDGLDLNLLVVLDALFSEKSVTRAGERIHLSQSATSGALSRLREYFKDDLLVPVGRKMVLTPLAEELAQPLRELLQQAEVVIRRTPAFSPESSERRFRIVMSDYIAIVIMARALPEIQRQAPGITLQILPLRTGALEHGDVGPGNPAETDSCQRPSLGTAVRRRVRVHCVREEQTDQAIVIRARLLAPESRGCPLRGTTGCAVAGRNVHGAARPGTPDRSRGGRIHAAAATDPGNDTHRDDPAAAGRILCRQMPLKIVKLPKQLPKLQEVMQWHAFRNSDPGLVWLRKTLKSFAV